MANVEHSDMTDTDGIHEPKGAGLLTGGSPDLGKVYKSDGAGSGTWEPVTGSTDAGAISLGRSTTPNATATTLTAIDTWYPVLGTFFEEDVEGMTSTVATGRLNIATEGDYIFQGALSVIASRANKILHVSFMVDGVQTGPRIRRMVTSTTAVGAIPIQCHMHGLTSGNYVQLCLESVSTDTPYTAGDTITVENCIFTGHLLRES